MSIKKLPYHNDSEGTRIYHCIQYDVLEKINEIIDHLEQKTECEHEELYHNNWREEFRNDLKAIGYVIEVLNNRYDEYGNKIEFNKENIKKAISKLKSLL